MFERGRDIFEEALDSVRSARDFGVIYSAYLKFEEELLTVIMEEPEEGEDHIVESLQVQDDEEMNQLSAMLDSLLNLEAENSKLPDVNMDSEDLAIKRVESLIERRDLLLNSCNLRQNPNLVSAWMERLDILKEDQQAYVRTFHEALTTVNPYEAEGELSDIWLRFAKFYEEIGDLEKANMVFWKAVKAEYKKMDDYINLWRLWTEMLLRQGAYSDAIKILSYVRITF